MFLHQVMLVSLVPGLVCIGMSILAQCQKEYVVEQ